MAKTSSLPAPIFTVHDHLGSTRISYSASVVNNAPQYTVRTLHDNLPFGKIAREYVNGAQDRYQFTGYQRDQESQLDYAQARMYDPNLGRFLGVDPLAGKFASWSSYLARFS
ncbi:MAG TPA: RHS repeat-associated core domain-containing protein [Luteibaculaceae bacterium]|nr:RHS repeat-associated core domain-containing protein [Luteibaculaceae bacterium]